MLLKANPPQEMSTLENNTQTLKVLTGSAARFQRVLDWRDYCEQPTMADGETQTYEQDFFTAMDFDLKGIQEQRERELENKAKVLEDHIKAYSELISDIHATSAKTDLLGEKFKIPPTHDFNKTDINHVNLLNSPNNNSTCIRKLLHPSPTSVNAAQTAQQVNFAPPETFKYTIIAERPKKSNEQPIEVPLVRYAGDLEVCSAHTDNIEVKNEVNTILTQEGITPNIPLKKTPSEDKHFIKKRRLTALTDSTHKRNYNGDSLVNTPNIEHKKINNDTNAHASPIESVNWTNSSVQNESATDEENKMVAIGPNNTLVSSTFYRNMNWCSASIATRRLLMAVFERDVLATHSLTGKASPAFKGLDKPVKQMLNPLVVADIIYAVTSNCKVSDKEVRNAITTKCSDENKMMKLQKDRSKRIIQEEEKENN